MSGTLGIGMTPSKTVSGEFLRTRRLKLELTQAETARISGMSQEYYSKLETGLRKTIEKQEDVEGISLALQCKPSKLIKLFQPKPLTKLGMLVWKLQIELGITREEFIRRSGMGRRTFFQIMNIDKGISYSTLESLLRVGLEIATLIKYLYGKEKPTKNRLGRLIRQGRKEQGLSLKDFAKKAGISHAYLSKIELGEDPLNTEQSNDLIARFAQLLLLDQSEIEAVRPPMKTRG